jgi:hypothetical protein
MAGDKRGEPLIDCILLVCLPVSRGLLFLRRVADWDLQHHQFSPLHLSCRPKSYEIDHPVGSRPSCIQATRPSHEQWPDARV